MTGPCIELFTQKCGFNSLWSVVVAEGSLIPFNNFFSSWYVQLQKDGVFKPTLFGLNYCSTAKAVNKICSDSIQHSLDNSCTNYAKDKMSPDTQTLFTWLSTKWCQGITHSNEHIGICHLKASSCSCLGQEPLLIHFHLISVCVRPPMSK